MRRRRPLVSRLVLAAFLLVLLGALDTRDAAATGSITGRVTGPDGEPLAGVEVQVHVVPLDSVPRSMFNSFPETRTGFAGWTVTGADGTYSLELAATPQLGCEWRRDRHYLLDFVPPKETGYTPKRYRAPDASTWLIVGEEKTLSGIDVRLGPPASIGGTMVGADGSPLAGAAVVARYVMRPSPYGGDREWRTTTDGRGRYVLTGLQDDDYFVQVIPSDDPASFVFFPGSADPVRIRPVLGTRTDGYNVVVPPRGRLAVSLASGHGLGLWGFQSERVPYLGYASGTSSTFDGLPPGEYLVGDFGADPRLGVTFFEGTFQREDAVPVTVAPGALTSISIVPAPPGTIVGRVVDGSGALLADVEIRDSGPAFCDWPTAYRTGADGRFSIPAGGDRRLRFGKDGFLAAWAGGGNDWESANILRVRSGETLTLPDVVLASRGAPGGIAGRVGAAGLPVPEARVEIWSSPAGAAALRTVVPDASGAFDAGGLAPGDYLLRYYDATPGSNLGDTWYPDAVSKHTATPVTVAPGLTTTGVDAVLGAKGTILGTMTPGEATFQWGPGVCLADLRGNPINCLSSTPADGTYRFDGVSPGSYLVAFDWKQDYSGGSWYPGVQTATGAEPIVVAPGQTLTGIDVTLVRQGVLEGQITSSTGPAATRVYAVDAGTGQVSWEGLVPSSGTGRISWRVPPGRYRFLVTFLDLDFRPQWYPGVSSAADAVIVEILPGQTTSLGDVVLEYWRYNHAPALADPGAIAATENAETAFTLSADDENGDLLTFTAANLPPGASFDPYTGAFSWTPTCTQAGTHPDIVFTVTDHGDPPRSDSKTVPVSVAGRDCAPVLDPIGARSVVAGETLAFTVAASDPEGDPVVLEATNIPAGASFNAADGAFSWTPGTTQVGVHAVTFAAVYTGNATVRDEETVAITVLGPLLFQDDFAHADLPADPDWVTAAGAWAVRDGALRSKLAGDAIALAGPANLAGDGFAAGRIRARVKLGPLAARTPNLKLVFAYRDPQHYRFVRFLPGATEIGQVGDIDGQAPLRVRKERGLAAGRWQGVRVDVHPDGLVRAFAGATTLAALKFAAPLPGAVGVATRDSQSFVDDFSLWARTVLQ